ncbi:unnamed protein product [Paramecium pentaurelia]|uniref:Casein kinase I n=1 Tax=Paramecium pentaurelia TaxID=43138 RepID=A0A8S1UV08_9CILI|nr:unnamed protein product [Paramecium pentaurelia]
MRSAIICLIIRVVYKLMSNQQLQKLINNTFITKKRVSAGSFGVVYCGQDINTRALVAIKIEKGNKEDSSLEREAEILKRLQKVPQIPKLYWAGKEGDSNVLVIQYLGRDLTHYMKTFRKFSLRCVLNIAEQMINIIENIHKNKVLHRDIKPENVLVGKEEEENLLFIVDFGISKFYKDENDSHISYRENQPFIGTTRYASINAHKGTSLSRRDDLESLGYMLIFLLKGQLPWQNLQFTDDEDKMRQVGQMKMKMEMNELCKGIPIEFGRFLEYIKGLPFKAEPNYKHCQQLFKKVCQEHNFTQKDLAFDWETGPKSDRNDDKRKQTIEGHLPSSQNSNLVNNKPSLFKKSKDDISSNNIGGSLLNYSLEQLEMNSLLKTPEQRKSNLTPDINRRKNRMQSVSSYNDSHSELENNGSVMLGIQPSMISRLSKLSFNSNSRVRDSKQNLTLTPEQKRPHFQEKKLTITPNSYMEQITSQKKKSLIKNSNSQQQLSFKKEEVEETIRDFSKMNETDEGIEPKYMLLKQASVNARFKKSINGSANVMYKQF